MSDTKATEARGSGSTGRTSPVAFLRQVIAELRKVVWPTQKQLGTYFVVVLVFVIVMVALVSLLDLGFGKLAFWAFTGGAS